MRRRVFIVVGVLTVVYLALYGLGTWQAFKEVETEGGFNGFRGVEPDVVAGATLLGLNMFGTLFLGTILAVFLTLGAVRGDAERGLLQPLLVRPVTRRTLLVSPLRGRRDGVRGLRDRRVPRRGDHHLGAWAAGGRTGSSSRRWRWPPPWRSCARCRWRARSSCPRPPTASPCSWSSARAWWPGCSARSARRSAPARSRTSPTGASWALPFEALYQSALGAITADTLGFTRLAIDLGPFGGAQDFGPLLWPWAIVYLGLVGAAALRAFSRRDL